MSFCLARLSYFLFESNVYREDYDKLLLMEPKIPVTWLQADIMRITYVMLWFSMVSSSDQWMWLMWLVFISFDPEYTSLLSERKDIFYLVDLSNFNIFLEIFTISHTNT